MTTTAATQRLERRLRLLIDLRWMIPGTAGGLENVAWCFLERLFDANAFADITLIVPNELMHRLRAITPKHVDLTSRDSLRADLLRLVPWAGKRRLRTREREVFDVVYAMNGRVHPDLRGARAVVLMADMQHFALPELFEPKDRQERAQASVEAAHLSALLLTISEFSRTEIIERLKVPPGKVRVTYLAADAVFQARPIPSGPAAILAGHGLGDEPYLLLPAQLWPHKNHAAVVAALEVMLAEGHNIPLLVCTGATDGSYAVWLKAHIADSPVADRVRFLGRVPRGDQPALYEGARALVFCSRYEGFGMPVVEAMATGCPVIAANGSALPEVAGGAAVLVPGDDPVAIAAAIHRVCTDEPERMRLIAGGLRRAAQFSWQRHFEEVIAAIWQAHGREAPVLQMRSTEPGVLLLPRQGDSLSKRFDESVYPKLRRSILRSIRRFKV